MIRLDAFRTPAGRGAAALLLAAALVSASGLPVCAQEMSEQSLRTQSELDGELGEPLQSSAREAMEKDRAARFLNQPVKVDLPGALDPDLYRVGPDDVFQLSLWGGISRTVFIEVGPEGTVLLPSTGSLKVDGMTLREARAAILAKLKPEFRGVSMDLRLSKPRTFRVYVTGQVKTPGPTIASGVSRAGELIAQAGPDGGAALRAIEVRHRDGTVGVADLELFHRTGDPALNPFVRDGDVLHVPIASSFVGIQGAVSRPGRFEMGPRDSLRTLLALGGGSIPAADSTRVLFTRWLDANRTDSTWTDLTSVRTGAFNPPLRNGDRLYIYFIPQYQVHNEVTVLGQVQRPGIYPVRVGRERISDIIRAAGGFLPGADLGSIAVRRANTGASLDDPELQRLLRLSRLELTDSEYSILRTRLAGQREEYRVDWNRLLQVGPALDILLVGGDVIEVERLVNSIRVDGEVRRPGIVEYRPGFKVRDYIDKAGGLSKRAWGGKVRVTRSVTGQTLLARDVASLDPGDFIWVPEKPDVTLWQQMTTVLMAVGQIATIVLAIEATQD
jgi:protein involved in polysaccharide export with SLBB domain